MHPPLGRGSWALPHSDAARALQCGAPWWGTVPWQWGAAAGGGVCAQRGLLGREFGEIGVKTPDPAAALRGPGVPTACGAGATPRLPRGAPMWLTGTSPYRAVSRFSACLSFLLLSAALLGPSWRDGGHPQDAGVLAGLCTKPACGNRRQAGGLSGLTAMVLYTLAEPGHAATLNITWTFCLASSRCPQ
ncbi:unnamed protein product [Eretmochelys imbricata]